MLKTTLKSNKYIITIVFVLALNWFLSYCVYAQNNTYSKKTVILLNLNFMGFKEFIEVPVIKGIMDTGAVSLMNTKTAMGNETFGSYATIGAGSRADVRFSSAYLEKKEEMLFIKNIDSIINNNNLYNAQIGRLGKFFHERELKTALLGIGEYINEKLYLPGALIATDEKGKIDFGYVYGNKENNNLYSNYGNSVMDFLYKKFEQVYPVSNLIIIDIPKAGKLWGNLHKVFSEELELFIYRIKELIDDVSLLIITSPHYSISNAQMGERLVPVVVWGKDVDKGILISGTTRRKGIIANIDIAPTIINFFEGDTREMTGHPVRIINDNNNINYIDRLNKLSSFNFNNRGNIIKTYISFQMFLLLVILFMIFCKSDVIKKITFVFQDLCLFVLSVPLSLFLMPFFNIFNILNLCFYYTVLLLLNTFITIGVYKICKTPKTRIILISAITAFAIGTDILTGSNLSKTSILGYDAIIGARYYGLGNEYMGVFVAVVLLFILPLVQQQKIRINIALTVLIFIIIIIGMPMFGANVGGTIMASIAFIFAFLSIKKHSLRYKNIIFGILLALLMIALFAVIDIYILKQKSHLGQALIKLFAGNIEAIRNIIIRKLQVNIRLLRWTIWSKILMATIIVMVAIFIKPGKTIYHLFRKYEEFKIPWYSILVGSLFGLVFNDSGVVVAATSNIFLVFSILYFWLGEEVYAYNRNRLR